MGDGGPFGGSCQIHGPPPVIGPPECEANIDDGGEGEDGTSSPVLRPPAFPHTHCPPVVHRTCFCVRFIAEHTKMLEDSTKVILNHFILKTYQNQCLDIDMSIFYHYFYKENISYSF